MIIYWQFFSSLKVILSTINNILYLLQCTERIPSLYKKNLIQPPKILRNFHKTKIKIFDLAITLLQQDIVRNLADLCPSIRKFFVKLIKCIGLCARSVLICVQEGGRERNAISFFCVHFFSAFVTISQWFCH